MVSSRATFSFWSPMLRCAPVRAQRDHQRAQAESSRTPVVMSSAFAPRLLIPHRIKVNCTIAIRTPVAQATSRELMSVTKRRAVAGRNRRAAARDELRGIGGAAAASATTHGMCRRLNRSIRPRSLIGPSTGLPLDGLPRPRARFFRPLGPVKAPSYSERRRRASLDCTAIARDSPIAILSNARVIA
jgi:hypothetical protein